MVLINRDETRGFEKLCGGENHGEIEAMSFKICPNIAVWSGKLIEICKSNHLFLKILSNIP